MNVDGAQSHLEETELVKGKKVASMEKHLKVVESEIANLRDQIEENSRMERDLELDISTLTSQIQDQYSKKEKIAGNLANLRSQRLDNDLKYQSVERSLKKVTRLVEATDFEIAVSHLVQVIIPFFSFITSIIVTHLT